MISEFVAKHLKKAAYESLDDGTFFAEIRGLKGVWASGKTLERCRETLKEVLEEWLLLKVASNERVPGIRIRALPVS